MLFQDKVAVVTGASAGIGPGIAAKFCALGARVALVSRGEALLGKQVDALRGQGYPVAGWCADVGDREAIFQTIEDIAGHYGQIDVLCANAGVYPSAPLEEMSLSLWDEVMRINATGTFLSVQACLPYLRNSTAARIVITSSITGPVTGIAGMAHYGASKAAQLGFMRSAALELAQAGITINAVLPGVIATEAVKALGEEFIAGSLNIIPLGRLGDVADIANAVCFFASPDSGFITGQTLIIDGGQTLPEAPGSF